MISSFLFQLFNCPGVSSPPIVEAGLMSTSKRLGKKGSTSIFQSLKSPTLPITFLENPRIYFLSTLLGGRRSKPSRFQMSSKPSSLLENETYLNSSSPSSVLTLTSTAPGGILKLFESKRSRANLGLEGVLEDRKAGLVLCEPGAGVASGVLGWCGIASSSSKRAGSTFGNRLV